MFAHFALEPSSILTRSRSIQQPTQLCGLKRLGVLDRIRPSRPNLSHWSGHDRYHLVDKPTASYFRQAGSRLAHRILAILSGARIGRSGRRRRRPPGDLLASLVRSSTKELECLGRQRLLLYGHPFRSVATHCFFVIVFPVLFCSNLV